MVDIEFHYWMTGIIAERAGFSQDEAAVIAYASEYVDENDVSIAVVWPGGRRAPYRNFVSQTMNILRPRRELMRVYPIFHFMPGDPEAESARRRDGHLHILNTTPDSENARTLFDRAFSAPEHVRLYRIGIATHMYADTWAHQNFVGWFDSFNHLDMALMPDIGHADALRHPDWPAHRWEDNRLVESAVDNRMRFLDAAEAIFKRYCRYLKTQGRPDHSRRWARLKQELAMAMGPGFSGDENWYREGRLQGYKSLVPWLPEFDERDWFNAAIVTRVRGLRDPGEGLAALFTLFPDSYTFREDVDHEQTHWFRFQEAVKEHERTALDLLEPLFGQMAVDIRKS
ncbi:MAG: hypothetical protein P8171_20735 [Candidatus Thiodiazotropha sp.]